MAYTLTSQRKWSVEGYLDFHGDWCDGKFTLRLRTINLWMLSLRFWEKLLIAAVVVLKVLRLLMFLQNTLMFDIEFIRRGRLLGGQRTTYGRWVMKLGYLKNWGKNCFQCTNRPRWGRPSAVCSTMCWKI